MQYSSYGHGGVDPADLVEEGSQYTSGRSCIMHDYDLALFIFQFHTNANFICEIQATSSDHRNTVWL